MQEQQGKKSDDRKSIFTFITSLKIPRVLEWELISNTDNVFSSPLAPLLEDIQARILRWNQFCACRDFLIGCENHPT